MIRGAIAALLLALAPGAAADGPQPLASNAWLIPGSFAPGGQPDGNSVLLEGGGKLLLVDTGRHAAHEAAIERAIAATGKPLARIVNTHWHLDHVTGNIALKAAHPGVRVSASNAIEGALTGFLKRSAEQARAALAAGRIPAAAVDGVNRDLATFAQGDRLRPDDVVTGDMVITDLGRPIDLHLAGNAATAGDVWLYDRANRLAIVGDLVTLPAPFLDTACPEGMRRALDRVAATPFERLVPGHGPIMDRAAFDRYRTAFGAFVDCAKGTGAIDQCGTAWKASLTGLVDPAQPQRTDAMLRYYAGLIRAEALKDNCPA